MKQDYVYNHSKYGEQDLPHANSVIKGVPRRYDHNLPVDEQHQQGYSDHFPIVVKLKAL